MDKQAFYQGTEYFAHEWLGAHATQDGVVFRTFAPAADGVVLRLWAGAELGSYSSSVSAESSSRPSSSAGTEHDLRGEWEMQRIWDGNFYEVFVPQAQVGDSYCFCIWHGGYAQEHADPYGRAMELRPNWHSIVSASTYTWSDERWINSRSTCENEPLNMYELHVGSWRKRIHEQESSNPADWYTYRELAAPLISHLKEIHATHVEFLPLSEYPFDGSWGYQPTGFFSPTSRYGTPDDLRYLIDQLHQANIGVILDVVPVHFATDAYGLANYDGTALFEYPNADVGVSEWGSHNFMYSRGETRSFMQSSLNYWLSDFHIDGLRMDAISRIIYWMGDQARGVNYDAVRFVSNMNAELHRRHPGCMLIAEDSTNYQGTTKPASEGGLDFDYKWDMGWMHDTLEFFQTGPDRRSDAYHKLSFSMLYFGGEKYLLPLSHDEVVHGKATIAQKMWGQLDSKFPQLRVLYMYMLVHPGKKLNFMGSEIAQLREWNEDREQDWFMTRYPNHKKFYTFWRALWQLYLEQPALWSADYHVSDTPNSGFFWRKVDDTQNVVYAIERQAAPTTSTTSTTPTAADVLFPNHGLPCASSLDKTVSYQRILAVFNLGTKQIPIYELTLPYRIAIQTPRPSEADKNSAPANTAFDVHVLLDTNEERFGGSSPEPARVEASWDEEHQVSVLRLSIEPFSGVLLGLNSL